MDETQEWQVYDDLSSTIELLPCKARIGRLSTLFANTLYSGPENETALDQKLSTTTSPVFYTFNQLLSIVQASQVELQRALMDMNAFDLNNHYRCIDTAYLHQMLDSLATNATILGYNVHAMSLEEAHACLDQDFATVPDPVRLAFLGAFMTDMKSSPLCLDNYKVCRFLGSIVLEMEKVSLKTKETIKDDELSLTFFFFLTTTIGPRMETRGI
jgi:sister chromatid cohesion protein DCC1